MSRKSLSRVAALAALATVGGLVVPLLTASAANAAPLPTKVAVVNAAGFAREGGTATYQVTLDQAAEAAHGVFVAVTSGPDSNPASPLAGAACSLSANVYTCSVHNGGQPGVDQLTFFYSATATPDFVPADPNTTGTLTIGGDVNAVTITPASAHAAQGVFQEYMVGATDAAGRPVSGAHIRVAGTQSNARNSDLSVQAQTTQPTSIGFDDPSTGPGTDNDTVTTPSTGLPGPVWIASKVVGSVSILASDGASASQAATLTVDAGTVNDITTVTATPPTQTAYTTKQVTVAVVLTNAAGDPIAGVTPLATIAGVDATQTVSASTSDRTGTSRLTYTAGTTAGTDTLTVWVNKTTPGHTAGKDADEASTTATVTTSVEDLGTVTGTGTTVPNGTLSATVSFAVSQGIDTTKPAAGVGLSFSVPFNSGYTLSAPTGTTDASGKASVTVTANDVAHATTTSVVVTARVTQDTGKFGHATVTWELRVASNVVIAPFAATDAIGGSSPTYKVTTTDQFGAPVAGVNYTWTVNGRNNSTNNTGATGTGDMFSYTDQAIDPTQAGGQDQVTVTAKDSAAMPVTLGDDTVNQNWVPGTAKAAQANIDLPPYAGSYTPAGTPAAPIFIPTDFTQATTTGTTADPAPLPASATVTPVEVRLVDAKGNPLFGDQVTFSSTGVGGFTDASGHPLTTPTSTTALVCDFSSAAGEVPDTACDSFAAATVFVRSAQTGTQTITAKADGVTTTAVVTYTGQYVPVSPERVADTRTGQGSITTLGVEGGLGGAPAPVRLAPNTSYVFSYGATDMPVGAAAYAFNVTAIDPSGAGNLRVAPEDICSILGIGGGGGSTVPKTSLINYQPGKTVANFTVIPSADASACGGVGIGAAGLNGMVIYSGNSSVSVAVDLVGYYPSAFVCPPGPILCPVVSLGITPLPGGATRVVDTRTGLGGGAVAPVAANTSRSFQISGQAGIPADGTAKAVALNVVAVGPKGLGNLRIYPDGSATPTASSINYIKGVDKAAFVIVNLPANGKIDVFSAGSAANVVIDAYEYIPDTATMVTQAPVRILDTRTSTPLEPSVPRNVQVGGKGGVPADAQAVLVSLTSIHTAKSTGVGNLRIYPTGVATPNVSTLNYVSKTSDVANFAIVKLGTSGQVTLFSGGSEINAAIDVVGYIPAG